MTKVRSPDPVFLEVPVPVRTGRLMLCPPAVGDGVAIAEAVAESYDALHPWFHEGMGSREREGATAWQEMIAKRIREGLEAAKRCGRVGRRPPALTAAQRDEVRRMKAEGRHLRDIAALFKASPQTVRRTLQGGGEPGRVAHG